MTIPRLTSSANVVAIQVRAFAPRTVPRLHMNEILRCRLSLPDGFLDCCRNHGRRNQRRQHGCEEGDTVEYLLLPRFLFEGMLDADCIFSEDGSRSRPRYVCRGKFLGDVRWKSLISKRVRSYQIV